MNFINQLASVLTGGTNVQQEVAQVESELQTVAYIVGAFMLIVVFELGLIIALLGKRRKS